MSNYYATRLKCVIKRNNEANPQDYQKGDVPYLWSIVYHEKNTNSSNPTPSSQSQPPPPTNRANATALAYKFRHRAHQSRCTVNVRQQVERPAAVTFIMVRALHLPIQTLGRLPRLFGSVIPPAPPGDFVPRDEDRPRARAVHRSVELIGLRVGGMVVAFPAQLEIA